MCTSLKVGIESNTKTSGRDCRKTHENAKSSVSINVSLVGFLSVL